MLQRGGISSQTCSARRLREEEIITCGSCQDDSTRHHCCFRSSFLLTSKPFVKFFIKLFYIVGRKKRLEINIHGMNTISAFHRAPVAGIFAPTLCRAYFRWHAALRYTRSFDSREIARAGFQGGGRSGSVWLRDERAISRFSFLQHVPRKMPKRRFFN